MVWHQLKNWCTKTALTELYTYTGVSVTVHLDGGEGNATKAHTLALGKMAPFEAALEINGSTLAEKYRNYFFSYRAPRAVPAADTGNRPIRQSS
jgi:hypothetical protein